MREWKRAVVHLLCGGCGRLVSPGEPVLVLTNPRIKHRSGRFFRCSLLKCADEAVPLELPRLPARLETKDSSSQAPFQPLRGLALDFGRRLVGEREPGEDDD